jgi:hypothetical protein
LISDAVLQRSRTFVLATRLPENATTCTSVGVLVATTAVFVGVFVRVGVGTTAVFVGVLVGVRVGGTAVFVGVLVGVLVGTIAVFVGVLVGVLVGTIAVFVGVFVRVGVGVPCSGLNTVAPCRAGLAQLAEGPAGAAKLELCLRVELGFVLVRDVPANDESTMPPTTAATSTVIPTTLPIGHLGV